MGDRDAACRSSRRPPFVAFSTSVQVLNRAVHRRHRASDRRLRANCSSTRGWRSAVNVDVQAEMVQCSARRARLVRGGLAAVAKWEQRYIQGYDD